MAGAMMQEHVRLARGRHRTPDGGACVMELASMLAGERFSDRPRCVDPVIAAFLRAFNDRLDTRSREALRPYARAVLCTRGDRRVTRARRARCLAFAHAGGRLPRLRLALLIGIIPAVWLTEGAAEWAAREAIVRGEELGFSLLDDLLADGGVPSPRRLELEPAPLPLAVVGLA
jgi:hypothetical protein